MEKIKIRFFINTLAGGGAEKVLINLLNSLDPSVYEITLLSVIGGIHAKSLPRHVKHRQILKKQNSALLRRLVYHMPPAVFNRLFSKGDYDIEVAYLEGLPTRIVAGLKTKARKIAFLHMDVTKDDTFDLLYKSKQQCIAEYRRFDRVSFVSEGVQEGFFGKYGKLDNGCVIHNIIDDKQIQEKCLAPTDIHFTTKGLKIVMAGRLEPVKGIDRVLAVAAVLQEHYDFQVLVLGMGKEYDALLKIKEDKNVNCVDFLGYQENPYPIIAQADLLLCASRYEGYSTVVSEALELGVPVLTTNCAGMEEQLCNGKYGMIVDNHTSALQEGLRHFLENTNICSQFRKNILENRETRKRNSVSVYNNLFCSLCENDKG